MTKAAEKAESKSADDRIAALEASNESVWATIRKLLKTLENHYKIDIDRDGKIGGVRLVALVGLCLLCAVGVATAGVVWSLSSGDGNLSASSSSGQITLTTDKIVVTNSLTVNAGGTVTLPSASVAIAAVAGGVSATNSIAVNGATLITATNDIAVNGATLVTATNDIAVNGATLVTATNDVAVNGATLITATNDIAVNGATLVTATNDIAVNGGILVSATNDIAVNGATLIVATNDVAGIMALTNGYTRAAAGITFASGTLDVVDTTQLVFIVGGVTNVLDGDITTP